MGERWVGSGLGGRVRLRRISLEEVLLYRFDGGDA
jgi:hypothetical protein